MLSCAISLGREGPGSCFTTTGLLSVDGVVNGHVRTGVGFARIRLACESMQIANPYCASTARLLMLYVLYEYCAHAT